MAKPKFYLDSKINSKGNYPILLKYSFNGLRLKYYTGISVSEKHFQPNCNTGNAKPIKSIAPYSEQNNNKLYDISHSAVVIVSEAKGQNISIPYVREQLDLIYKPKQKENNEDTPEPTFIEFYEQFLQDCLSGKRLIKSGKNKGLRFSHNSIKNYKTTLSALKRYLSYYNINSLYFEDINAEFYDDFKEFCYNIEEKEISTFSGYIKDIKSIMIESKSIFFDKNSLYIPSYESDTVALSLEQIDQIRDLDLSDYSKFIVLEVVKRYRGKDNSNKPDKKEFIPQNLGYQTLDNVRDLFLIGCYSGLRFSDFSNLSLEKIEDGFIRLKQIKTGKRVTIPVMSRFNVLIDKYNGSLPYPVSNQHFNRVIKHVVKLAGLDHNYSQRKTNGNTESFIDVPFYSLVSSHTARRSYATIMFKAGVPPMLIMSATGHTTEQSFLKYIRANNEDKSRLLAETIKKLGL